MSKKSIYTVDAPFEIAARLAELAPTRTAAECAKILAAEFPDYDIAADTLMRLAYMRRKKKTQDIRFLYSSSPGHTAVDKPAPQAELSEVVRLERQVQAQKERNKLLSKKYKEAQRRETTAERLIGETLGSIPVLEPAPAPVILKPHVGEHRQDALCLMGDLHFGEVVDRQATMGIGEYDPRIAIARYQEYVDSVLDLAKNHHSGETFGTLWVVDIGDNITGAIHDELRATNAFPLGEQMVRCSYLLAEGLRDLAKYFDRVEFIGMVGNHPRFERKPFYKEAVTNNGDYVIYKFVEQMLADQPNVHFTIPKSPFWVQEIQGHPFFFAHGGTIRMFYRFPWYGAGQFITQMTPLIVKAGLPIPEYWGMGHFHVMNINQLSYGEWLFTGSFKGPDEFTIGKITAGTAPVQLFVGVHPRRGVSFRYPITLGDADIEGQVRYAGALTDSIWEVS